MPATTSQAPRGLDGVVAVRTRLSHVDGLAGELIIGGYELNNLAGRVTFEEAATAFRDPLSATGPDPDHSVDEERFVTFAASTRHRLLVIAHTERGDTIRIISARPATPPSSAPMAHSPPASCASSDSAC